MSTYKPTLGGDPEFFVYVSDDDGKHLQIKTADKFLPPKGKPLEVTPSPGTISGKCHFDGVQAEINPHESQCREVIIQNIHYSLQKVYTEAINKLKTKNIVFAPLASITVTPEDIKDTDMECRRFGCSPDVNIYNHKKIEYPDGNEFMTRFSGGHIHFGFDQLIYAQKFKQDGKLLSLVKAFDYIPGLLSVAISPGKEEVERRKWYGRAGSYRIQKHGIEYRPLSSYWLVSPPLTSLAYGLARDALLIVFHDLEKELFDMVSEKEVVRIINEMDAKSARKIFFEKYKPFYLEKLVKEHNDDCLISNSPYREIQSQRVIDNIIKKSYHYYFDPYKTMDYWRLKSNQWFDGSYGIQYFSSDVEVRGKSDTIKRMTLLE